jgi:3-oxoacyl-[acyl-carrier protein] reductase
MDHMELNLEGKSFIVTGASSGFGRSVAEALLAEGARVIVVARRKELLDKLCRAYPNQASSIVGDVLEAKTREMIVNEAGRSNASGIFINAGGPPAGGSLEINMDHLDYAYELVMKWKIDLLQS